MIHKLAEQSASTAKVKRKGKSKEKSKEKIDREKYVPYRDSVLTWILKENLGEEASEEEREGREGRWESGREGGRVGGREGEWEEVKKGRREGGRVIQYLYVFI